MKLFVATQLIQGCCGWSSVIHFHPRLLFSPNKLGVWLDLSQMARPDGWGIDLLSGHITQNLNGLAAKRQGKVNTFPGRK